MCKPGSFSPTGAATQFGPCVDCPGADSFLGQTSCSSKKDYIVGDVNGDGVLTEREVLHLLFTHTDGLGWGSKFQETWTDMESSACELPGIVCEESKVAQINLTDAKLCIGHRKHERCLGIPSELGLLSELTSFHVKGGFERLKGTIPQEFASLKKLTYLNLEGSMLYGSITHLVGLESLRVLNLQNCGIKGPLPLFDSSHKLEVLNLALNEFTGTIPESYGHMSDLRELILVREVHTRSSLVLSC